MCFDGPQPTPPDSPIPVAQLYRIAPRADDSAARETARSPEDRTEVAGSMSASFSVLPNWKKDAPLWERLMEIAQYARAKPERFERFVMAFTETLPNGHLRIRTMDFGCDLCQQVGLFELGKTQVVDESGR